MAARQFHFETGAVTLLGTETTMFQLIAPTNFPVVVREVVVTILDATTGVQYLINAYHQDPDTTGGTSITPLVPIFTQLGTVQSTATLGAYSVQPTDNNKILSTFNLQPQAPFSWTPNVVIEGGEAFGMKMWQPTTQTGSVRIRVRAEE